MRILFSLIFAFGFSFLLSAETDPVERELEALSVLQVPFTEIIESRKGPQQRSLTIIDRLGTVYSIMLSKPIAARAKDATKYKRGLGRDRVYLFLNASVSDQDEAVALPFRGTDEDQVAEKLREHLRTPNKTDIEKRKAIVSFLKYMDSKKRSDDWLRDRNSRLPFQRQPGPAWR